MTEYFFPIILFAFLILYLFFENARIRKLRIMLSQATDQVHLKKCRSAANFSSLLIMAAFTFSLCYTFSPGINSYSFTTDLSGSCLVSMVGMLVVKLSFICLLIAGLLISKEMDSALSPLTHTKICRSGILMLFLVVFLTCGVFVFASNAGTLIIFSGSVFSFFWNRKKLKQF